MPEVSVAGRARDSFPRSKRQYVPQPMPGFLKPLHPKVVDRPPTGERWLHEIKHDGYRFQTRVAQGEATLFTRRGLDWTEKLPELAQDLSALGDCILDGEVCLLRPDGRSTFSGLRSAIGKGETTALVYFVFDGLWRGQDDLRAFSLADRREILAGLLHPILGERVRLTDSFAADGPAMLASACRLRLEGIVSKRRDSKYVGGRSDLWVKSLCKLAQEFVIGG